MTAKKTPRTTKNRQSNKEATIQYYIERANEPDVIVEVPAHWKVTFGYVNPSKSRDSYQRGDGHAVRMYEGEKLRMVMGNATGLRDLSIPLANKVEKQVGESKWEKDSSGNFKEENSLQIEAETTLVEEDDPF